MSEETYGGRTRAQLREELIRRLESGTIEQGRGQLRKGDAMCCLAVACDVFDPSKWNGDDYGTGKSAEAYCLPPDVKNAFGFYYRNGAQPDHSKDHLALQNDNGKTFPEIAAELRTGKYWTPLPTQGLQPEGGR